MELLCRFSGNCFGPQDRCTSFSSVLLKVGSYFSGLMFLNPFSFFLVQLLIN